MLALVAALALPMAPLQSPEAEVAATIDALHVAASSADSAAYFALFTPDARFIGTDAAERWTLPEFRAYAEPVFARGQGWTYTPVERTVTLAPIACRCIAWFDEVLNNKSYGVTRGSGVLRLTDGGWKIEQYVLSFAVPNDQARAVVETIRSPE
ncbi:hypothetical protein GCM10009116_16830 [Brevundimonas basaltis]|uniref:SnoaL-like domain-containing protein n=1 Tax=Brevundimonas basaltis TaxID=472166 RepID=A0A7W8HW38_9CAUL|nr:nuclear transport factor 2 family protein [Brevundimonas basaltis]MBB5291006.1 hypothetical protein [Brevundimonas basaltis]